MNAVEPEVQEAIALCEEHGLTDDQFARLLEVSAGYWSLLKNGKRKGRGLAFQRALARAKERLSAPSPLQNGKP